MSQKHLLIYWPTRNFLEVIKPLLPVLQNNYKIFAILSNCSHTSFLFENLLDLKHKKIIEEFYITPPNQDIVKNILFLKKITPELRKKKFDLWLTGSEIQPNEKYLIEYILPDHCFSICMWNNITYLLMKNQSVVEKILKGEGISKYVKDKNYYNRNYNSLFVKIKKLLLKRNLEFVIWRIKKIIKKFTTLYTSLFLLFITKKIYRINSIENITQLGSGRSNAYIFFDEIETLAHKYFFKNSKLYTAQYPSFKKCSCKKKYFAEKIILSPLSGWEQKKYLETEIYELFYRDIKTTIDESGASCVHLRKHPDFNEKENWSYYLRDYLIKKGINAVVVDSNKPIRTIICNYIGVVGFASAALRDARAACNYAFITGFTSVSKYYFKDPVFAFGNSEGIDWINEDGSYNKDIFIRKKFFSPNRITVTDIINKITEKKNE